MRRENPALASHPVPRAREQYHAYPTSECSRRTMSPHNVAAHLDGVSGRPAGDVAGFSASADLSALDIVWTENNLA